MKTWGKHLVLNCSNCDYDTITDPIIITNFAKKLVEEINMVAYGDPQLINFGTGDKAGYTLVQLIETSNITGHFANDRRAIFLDIFSCKNFDENTVIDLVVNTFKSTHIEHTLLWRDA